MRHSEIPRLKTQNVIFRKYLAHVISTFAGTVNHSFVALESSVHWDNGLCSLASSLLLVPESSCALDHFDRTAPGLGGSCLADAECEWPQARVGRWIEDRTALEASARVCVEWFLVVRKRCDAYLGCVCIRARVQETWVPKHPFMDLAFGLMLEPRFDFSNYEMYYFGVGTAEIWWDVDVTFLPLHSFILYSPTPV